MNPIFSFLLALTAVLAATANAGGAVLDVDGDPIFHDSYYVIPFSSGEGGGLTLSPRGDNQCPLYVGLEESMHNVGIPVRFSNWRSRVGFVPESENLNIEMDVNATTCDQSTYWWVARSKRKMFVEAGPKPDPREDSSKSFFQIKTPDGYSYPYKIVFCVSDSYCIDVGIFRDRYGTRLGLSSTPFLVDFVKTYRTETSSKTLSII